MMTANKELKTIADIDRAIHSPARLMILAYLAAVDSADFIFLMNQVGLTRGNLSSHLGTLEASGYVSIQKEFIDKMPCTIIRLTDVGRKAIQEYRDQMRIVIDELLGDRKNGKAKKGT
jgi:DNA-binding MarR family transcriptional regulator